MLNSNFRCFHVADIERWKIAQQNGIYTPSSFRSDGFIHCCTEPQLSGVLSRYFQNTPNILVLELNSTAIVNQIQFENLENGTELFPHLYSAINIADVIKFNFLEQGEQGGFNLSEI